MLIHLIGPGGAGKTTTAQSLKKEFNFQYYDLDEIFMVQEGDISKFINTYGYREYAIRNLKIYTQLLRSLSQRDIHIVVCSSGFMCYSDDISRDYLRIKKQIENHDLTFLLLPSLDFETCINEIVDRQMMRSYLSLSKEKEERKIRSRFPIYNDLKCKKILTNQDKNKVVFRIYSQISERLSLQGKIESVNEID